jgi:hypothetical protein
VAAVWRTSVDHFNCISLSMQRIDGEGAPQRQRVNHAEKPSGVPSALAVEIIISLPTDSTTIIVRDDARNPLRKPLDEPTQDTL